jgi:hypothetical protein
MGGGTLFTPGPWIANGNAIQTQSGEYVANLSSPRGAEQRERDARLIAAAPELYDAAQTAMTAIRPLVDQGEDRIWRAAVRAMDALSAACAKARGEQ